MKSKRFYVALICSILLCIGLIFVFFFVNQESSVVFSAVLQWEQGEQEISCWENDEDQLYVFLPSGVKLENVRLVKKTQATVWIDGQVMTEEVSGNTLALDVPYSVTYRSFGKEQRKTITFVQSAGVPTLFLSTASGSTEYLHADKNNKESGTVRLYTADGELDYEGTAASIGGRGNYSWTNTDKKPYNVILDQEANLLNIGSGCKWVLLCNSGDFALMRNKIVYDFANKIGLEYSPNSQWVDLYLNGEYRGLYLISEPVEIGADRIDISPTDGQIIALETEDSFIVGNDTYFKTNASVAVGIHSPKNGKDETIEAVAQKIQSVENAILDPNNVDSITGKSLDELIDMDSWAKKYLIDEVFGNFDSFMRSAYFYYSGSSDLLYAGPVWDYDLSIGNETFWELKSPQTFWGNRPSWSLEWDTPWIYALCNNEEFHNQVVETYQAVFLPNLAQLLDETIYGYANEISQAAAVDKVRWADDIPLETAVDNLCGYLEKRIDFLNQIWIEEREYYTVQAVNEQTGFGVRYVVFAGEKLEDLPEFVGIESTFVGWYDNDGNQFDVDRVITKDMQIYAKFVESPVKQIKRFVKLAPVAAIAIIFVVLVAIWLKRIPGKRGKKDG